MDTTDRLIELAIAQKEYISFLEDEVSKMSLDLHARTGQKTDDNTIKRGKILRQRVKNLTE